MSAPRRPSQATRLLVPAAFVLIGIAAPLVWRAVEGVKTLAGPTPI